MKEMEKNTIENIYNQAFKAVRDNSLMANLNTYYNSISMIFTQDNMPTYWNVINKYFNNIYQLKKLYEETMKPSTNLYFVGLLEESFVQLRDVCCFILNGNFDKLVKKVIKYPNNNHNRLFIAVGIANLIANSLFNDELMEFTGKELIKVLELN